MVARILSLGLCLIVATKAAPSDSQCVLNGAEAVSDLMDAGVYAWAASQRCGKGSSYIVKCEIDVASAVESVNRMINVILRAVDQCGNLHTAHPECSLAASKLTQYFAGISAASGSVVQECPNELQKSAGLSMRDELHDAGQAAQDANWPQGEQTTCLLDVKDSMSQLFEASRYISGAKESCDDKGKCAYNLLGIMSSFAGLGKFLMGAVGHCHAAGSPGVTLPASFPLACAESIDSLIGKLTGFAGAAAQMSDTCGHEGPTVVMVPLTVEVPVTPAPRLYVEDERPSPSTPTSALNTVLAMLLPVTAVVSFVGGLKLRAHQYANPVQRETYTSLAPLVSTE